MCLTWLYSLRDTLVTGGLVAEAYSVHVAFGTPFVTIPRICPEKIALFCSVGTALQVRNAL